MAQSSYKDHTMLHWNLQLPVKNEALELTIAPKGNTVHSGKGGKKRYTEKSSSN